MSLNQAQKSMVERARAIGSGRQGVALSDGACTYIIGVVATDLALQRYFPELPPNLPDFFGGHPVGSLEVRDVPFEPLVEPLVELAPDADSYFACLAQLHKSRLKYERILGTQPTPTTEQVGPRALLEFGKLSPSAIGAYLFWRKWMFDIDNRAAQETGYLFEPIIAAAIGGVPASAGISPVHRHEQPGRGRQVDCIRGDRAYEFKLRVTVAASGQGRWREELTFPRDCRESGFTPVLVVLDATPNPKLTELSMSFESAGGECFIGSAAWRHLDQVAGPTMGKFLELYVHRPLQEMLKHVPDSLPPLTLRMDATDIAVQVGGESFTVIRTRDDPDADGPPSGR